MSRRVYWHGVGLTHKLWWSPNGPVLPEIRACRVHRRHMAVCYRVFTGGAYKLKYTTADRSLHGMSWSKAITEAIIRLEKRACLGVGLAM